MATSLGSDIRGGVNYGIDTCWFNPGGKVNKSDLVPTYEVAKLEGYQEYFVAVLPDEPLFNSTSKRPKPLTRNNVGSLKLISECITLLHCFETMQAFET